MSDAYQNQRYTVQDTVKDEHGSFLTYIDDLAAADFVAAAIASDEETSKARARILCNMLNAKPLFDA